MASARFRLSDEFRDRAAAAFRDHERRIRTRLPDAEIRHRGGTSVRGVLTSGDVDVHVRVAEGSFDAARDALSDLYEAIHRDAWSPDESAFFGALGTEPPVEIALTVIGSTDDFHHGEAWDRLADDPDLIELYNALKRRHAMSEPGVYDLAKRAFFSGTFPESGRRGLNP